MRKLGWNTFDVWFSSARRSRVLTKLHQNWYELPVEDGLSPCESLEWTSGCSERWNSQAADGSEAPGKTASSLRCLFLNGVQIICWLRNTGARPRAFAQQGRDAWAVVSEEAAWKA